MGNFGTHLFLLILLSLSSSCMSWFWSSSSYTEKRQSSQTNPSGNPAFASGAAAEFSIDGPKDDKGIERLRNAERKLQVGSKSCWHEAYHGIFAACSEIASDDNEKRKRFAWDLSNCFQKDSGRPPFPSCKSGSSMKQCLEKLDNDAIHTYRGFFLETHSICHQLQSDIFRRQTERLVTDLKRSAEYTEEKLGTIEEKSEHLLQGTKGIQDSLTSIDQRTQQVAQTSKQVSDHVSEIMKQSEAVFEQSEKISASQSELQKGQERMKEKLKEGIVMLHESYQNLDKEVGNLRGETLEIEKEITRVGDTMSTKMSLLQTKAEDIESVAGISLERQKELLNGQSEALDGLNLLTKFQSQALEESREVLQQLAKFGHEQQEELLRRQEQLQHAHDHLVENSKSMLAAQEAFEHKQAAMFVALDKLFNLHNALLLESRLIKSFFAYSISMLVLYMFTSTKQTYTIRHRLYIGLYLKFLLIFPETFVTEIQLALEQSFLFFFAGLFATLLIEFAILRFVTNGMEHISFLINLDRSLFVLFATIQILHAVFTYR
ncbi:hypothetical protein UlMin_014163 [Ulmus minor]